MSVRFEMRLSEADVAALERQKARTGLEGAQVFRTLLHWADSGGQDYAPAQPPPPKSPRGGRGATVVREGVDRITVGAAAPSQITLPADSAPRRSWIGSRLDKTTYLKGKGIK